MANDARLIDTPARRDDALDALAPAKVLAVDTEFLWERTYAPQLALVQVAGVVDDRVVAFAFDPLEIELDPLDELLGDDCQPNERAADDHFICPRQVTIHPGRQELPAELASIQRRERFQRAVPRDAEGL